MNESSSGLFENNMVEWKGAKEFSLNYGQFLFLRNLLEESTYKRASFSIHKYQFSEH